MKNLVRVEMQLLYNYCQYWMDLWVYLKRKEEECRIKRTVGIGTSQFGDRVRWFG